MNGYRDEPATKKDLDQLKQELIAKIDANGAKINANGKKIEQVEQKLTHRIDQVEQSLSAKIDANGAKIDEVERNLTAKIDANSASIDRLTAQVVENHEAISKTLTREEYKKDYNELLRGQDEMMVVLTRIDQERIATNARIDRVERDGERLKER